ncbi:MAG: hypothetical protein IIC93_00790 [Chloroflexi bacterium]|nr:hypothetical protein [Chloroflexota bacterium]
MNAISTGPRHEASRLRWLFALAALTAMLAPLAGAALDHDFAERQPGHTHVYFGGAAAVGGDEHAYTADHSHDVQSVIAVSSNDVLVSAAPSQPPLSKLVVSIGRTSGEHSSPGRAWNHLRPPGDDAAPDTYSNEVEPDPPRA